MPSIRLSKSNREKLLGKLRDGHDVESAGAALGLTEAQIELARDKFGTEIATAFKTGTARLRAQIMDTALSSDNAAVLLKLLEERERQAIVKDPITLVERIIVNQSASCPHCHQPLIVAPSTSTTPSGETP